MSAPEPDIGLPEMNYVDLNRIKQIDDSTFDENFVRGIYVPSRSNPPRCSCVLYAKWYLNREDEVWGNAGALKPSSQEPKIGSVVITSEGKGHVAVVTDIIDDTLYIAEANYVSCKLTTRQLKIGDVRIRGYL